MKAVRLHQYQKDPVIESTTEPEIHAPWDIIVKVGAAGLCRTDLHIIEGQWANLANPTLPYTLGHENSGWVEAVGSAVTNVAVGDTVIMHPITSCGLCAACRAGDDSHCTHSTFPGLNTDGGMADYMRTNARAVVKLAPSMQPKDIAALADAGITAYHAVRKAASRLRPGTSAVVIGAGGLGHIGIQVLAAITATNITVVDTSERALELARKLGAHHTVLAGKGHDTVKDVLDITNGGADIVFDFVGEHGTEKTAPQLIKNGGAIYMIGYGGEVQIPTIEMISREISVIGNLVGTYDDLVELMELTKAGRVKLQTNMYPLDDAADAFHDLRAGAMVGRGILIP